MTTDPEIPAEPIAEEQELVDRLMSGRTLPGARFRGALGRRLAARNPGSGPRPRKLRLIVAAYVVAGVAFLALGLLQASGSL